MPYRVQPERRASALAVFSAGTNIGIFLSFLVGGIVATAEVAGPGFINMTVRDANS